MGDIPQAELAPVKDNQRAVRRVGEPPGGFIGGFFVWDQFSKWADRNNYTGAEREWFLHYAPLSFFADRHDWHYLVTADERLLRESTGDRGWFRKGHQRITSVGNALYLAGQAMKAHGEVFYESPQPGHTIYTWSNSMYQYLARDLVSSRRRIFKAAEEPGETQDAFRETDRNALCVSVFDRVSDLLRGCDRIASVNGRREQRGALDEILYDLRALVSNAAGVIDSVAALAQKLFRVALKHDHETSLNRQPFRAALREAGAKELSDEAGRQRPLFIFLWAIRNPILHEGGLSGYTLHTGKGQFYKASLTEDQASKLRSLCGHREERLSVWGFEEGVHGLGPTVDGFAFARQLTVTVIEALDRLFHALSTDRGIPDLKTSWTADERKAVRRFRWLAGLSSSADRTDPAPKM
jgi:hypothetical protein